MPITTPNGEVIQDEWYSFRNFAEGLKNIHAILVNNLNDHTANVGGIFRATSTTQIRMEQGSKTLTLAESNRGFGVGAVVSLYHDTGSQVLHGVGTVTNYDLVTNALTVDITAVVSGGDLLSNDWIVTLTGLPGDAGPAGLPGGGSLQAAYDGGQTINGGGITITDDTAGDTLTINGAGSGYSVVVRDGEGKGISFGGGYQIMKNGSGIRFNVNGPQFVVTAARAQAHDGAALSMVSGGNNLAVTMLPNKNRDRYGLGQDQAGESLLLKVENTAGDNTATAVEVHKGADARFFGLVIPSIEVITGSATIARETQKAQVNHTGPVTVTIPASPSIAYRDGATIEIVDVAGVAGTHTITVSADATHNITTNYGRLTLERFSGAWKGPTNV